MPDSVFLLYCPGKCPGKVLLLVRSLVVRAVAAALRTALVRVLRTALLCAFCLGHILGSGMQCIVEGFGVSVDIADIL